MKFMSFPASELRRFFAAFTLALALQHSASAQSGLIGNTNNATTSDNIWSAGAYINAARFVAASNLTVTHLFARVTNIAGRYQCAIYSGSATLPDRLLGTTTEVAGATNGWNSFTFLAPVSLASSSNYWLAIWSDDANARVYYNSTTTGTLRWGQYNYGAWPTNLITTAGSTYNYCLYAVGLPQTGPVTLTAVVPTNGSTTAAVTTTVRAKFSRAMNAATLDGTTFKLLDATSNAVPGSITYDANNFTAVLTPLFPLGEGAPHTAIVTGGTNGVADAYGNRLTNDVAWFFTTAITPPTTTGLVPAAGLTVRNLTEIQVQFSKDVVGVNAGDLLVNGQPATNLAHSPGSAYVFTFPAPPTGVVNVAWIPSHGITDTLVPPNPFAGGAWQYVLDPNLPTNLLVITEVLAANLSLTNFADEDGELSDWIEIQNRAPNPVNLEGWSLSDEPDEPGLWTFPARTLGPGEFLVVFASGKDRRPTNTAANLHTNFKLARSGEPLALYSPDAPRQWVSGFTPLPEQRNDIAYGYDPTNGLRYFATPTPGASNGFSAIAGVVEPVHMNVPRGYFDQSFTLMLSCPTPGATIRYTTNGAEPVAGSPVFPASLTVTNTLLLRAVAFKTNLLPSRTATHTYLFNLATNLRSLPAISIVTDSNNLWGATGIWGISGGNYNGSGGAWQPTGANDYHNPSQRGDAWERPSSVEWIEPADNAGFQGDCGIRISGSDYRRPRIRPTSKISLRLYFRGDYGDGDIQYPLFPLSPIQSFEQVVLRGGYDDDNNPFIRDEIHRRLAQDTGQPAAHGSLAILFLNGKPMTAFSPTNSVYYNPTERVHEEFFQSYYGPGAVWDVITQLSPSGSVVDGVRTDFESLVNYINSVNPANSSAYTSISGWLDVTNFADYLLVNTYGAMGDWPGNNWRAARPRVTGGLWRFVIWDAEYGMGLNARNTNYNMFTGVPSGPDDGGSLGGTSEMAQLFQRMTNSPEFRLLWADRVQRHFYNGGALTQRNITNRVEELRQQLLPLLPAMDLEFRNWARDREPTYFTQMRNAGLLAARGAPSFSQHGGRIPAGFTLSLSHTNPAGGIYFTTDGTDPRTMFTGTPAPTATLYTNPIALNASVVVKARVRDGTAWSALTEAAFSAASLGNPVCFSEIMYNPPGGSAYEFIELLNPSASSVNLSGCSLNGVTFTFPLGTLLAPGARLVLGSNLSTNDWRTLYSGVTPDGWFAGNLSNAGERLDLLDPSGNLITSVNFSDGAGWPKAADGAGRSLELISPAEDPDSPANWQASAVTNGSPGAASSAPPATGVRLNEILADNLTTVTNGGLNPDWIELHNPTAAPVALAGWSLSDDGNERKFVFPAGTVIPAASFFSVWCDNATNAPGLHTGFALRKSGETLSLYNSATTRVDAVSFGLQLTDAALGRIGGAWTLTQPTLNATNVAAPLASQTNLVINEWLANSIPGQPDWLELYNRATNLPVPLTGLYLATSNNLFQLRARSFLGPRGFVQLLADNGTGPTNLHFNLSAAGDRLALYDATGALLQQLTFGPQTEGVSAGWLPDGTTNLTSFPGTVSPGASNYSATYSGPVLNEILARNRTISLGGEITDFVELRNPGTTNFDLTGFSLSVDSPKPGRWIFPTNTLLAAGAQLVIRCNPARLDSTTPGDFNLSNGLDGESGGAWLFNPAGQVVNFVQYGFQVDDLSIGLTAGQWRLLASPTPGSGNSAVAALGTNAALRVNEWMPLASTGGEWFELYNTNSLPVDLATIALTDDPSIAGRARFRPAPLSFIAPKGWVRWFADGQPGQGFNHVNFGLDAAGESLLVYRVASNLFTRVDAVAFNAQSSGVSQGRLPDGTTAITDFPGSPTPAASNYRLLTNVVFNELLTHTDPPYEDAVEFRNVGPGTLDLSRWYLSNDPLDRRKYQFPNGTLLTNGGFYVAYEYQFHPTPTNGFGLSSAYGEELWLSAADSSGNETGLRLPVSVGPAFNGMSFGRIVTSSGVDYAPLVSPTFGVTNPASLALFRTGTGAPNTAPRLSPVVLNEIFYRPPGGTNGSTEFIELHNHTTAPVPLFDPAAPTNTWHLGGGIGFLFPTNVTLPPGGYALIVDFDPLTNAPALADFRARYSLSPAIPVFGPFTGGLNNTADEVALFQPDNPQTAPAPDAGFVPFVRVERVSYTASAPWPLVNPAGNSQSLQRAAPGLYGNEALNWFAAAPTPGANNSNANADSDNDGIPDSAELALGLNPLDPADAAQDNDLDGMTNLAEYLAGTDHLDPASRLQLSAQADATGIVLSFSAASNRTYSVLYKNQLADPAWTKLSDVPAASLTRLVTLTNQPTSAQRLYRLTTPALP